MKNRRIIFGLKSDSSSRDILLMLLKVVADPGDCLTAVHVQENDDHGVDLNTFHIHEDLCKSKQVERSNFKPLTCSADYIKCF